MSCGLLAQVPPEARARCGADVAVRVRPVIDTAATRRVARFENAAEWRGEITLVGDDIPFFLPPLHDSLFTAFRAGKLFDVPPQTARAFFPRIAASGDTLLVTTWTQPPDTFSRKEVVLPPLTTIWAATRGTNGNWSTPIRLDSVTKVFADATGTLLAASAHPTIHLFYPVVPANGGAPAVFEFTLERGQWKRSLVPGTEGAVYANAVEAPSGFMAIAFIAPDAKRAHDENSIQLITSSDDGRHWGEPTVLGHGGASDPIVLLERPGTLHILWRQTPATANGHATIRHVVAAVESTWKWSMAGDLTPAPGFLRFSAALDGCGVIHLAYEDWHGGGDVGDVDYARWSGAWSIPRHLLPHTTAVDPLVMIDARGRVSIFMLARPDSASPNGRWTNVRVNFPPRG